MLIDGYGRTVDYLRSRKDATLDANTACLKLRLAGNREKIY